MKTKTKKKSPTARALEQLRKEGHVAQVVERWNQFAHIRQDLFGFIDLLYLTEGSIVAVQVTTGDNHAARKTKILAEPGARKWIKAGGVLELWSYSLAGSRGARKLWALRKEEIVIEDFQE